MGTAVNASGYNHGTLLYAEDECDKVELNPPFFIALMSARGV
jgi:hypothetical protein